MKITIFDDGGFAGSPIADRLLRNGHALRIFERPQMAPSGAFTTRDDPICDARSNLMAMLPLPKVMLHYLRQRCAFNISSETGTKRRTFISMQEMVLQLQRRYLPGRRFDIPMSVLDNNLATNQLGWAPEVALENGTTRTAAYMKQFLRK